MGRFGINALQLGRKKKGKEEGGRRERDREAETEKEEGEEDSFVVIGFF